MDRREAKLLLLRRLVRERQRPYAQHVDRVGESESQDVHGPSGASYQLEIQWLWDAEPGGDIRVLGAIDDGGWRACCPLGFDFLSEASVVPTSDGTPQGRSLP